VPREDGQDAFLERLAVGSRRSNEELLATLGEHAVTDDAAVDRATKIVARLVTKQPLTYMRACLGASHLQAHVTDPALPSRVTRLVASRANAVNRRVFELYERDFGSTRRSLHRLDELAEHPEHMVPYFEVLVQNAVSAIFGVAEAHQQRLAAPWVERLLGDDAALLGWIEAVVARGDALKLYGGDTNTLLGIYDWIRDDPTLGFSRIPIDAESRFDLGAGFGTPYLEDVFGTSFVALDLRAPGEARKLGLALAVQAGPRSQRRALDAAEHEAYYQRLDRQPWRRFDVFADAFPTDAASYLVVSFGFLSSTVTSLSPAQPPNVPPRLRPLQTTFTALRRVIELVGHGKDVSLFTFHRATSRAYMNRAIFLRFVGGRLSDHGIAAEPFQGRYARGVLPVRRARRGG
jgi:hypothetical protein